MSNVDDIPNWLMQDAKNLRLDTIWLRVLFDLALETKDQRPTVIWTRYDPKPKEASD